MQIDSPQLLPHQPHPIFHHFYIALLRKLNEYDILNKRIEGGDILRKFLIILAVLLYQICMSSGIVTDKKQETNVGNPSENSYTAHQAKSRVPWDMIIQDGKLYIGGGDYGQNTGPVDVYSMDLETKQWTISGTLNDEAIGKFVRIGDQVYAPGFDAKGAQNTGNYYLLEESQWTAFNNIPGAAHNFDITEHDGSRMFAIGTWGCNVSPVQATKDDGQTYWGVPFYKDGVNIVEEAGFDFMRVYDFFTTENGLYCLFVSVIEGKTQPYEFYRYDNGSFHFVATNTDTNIPIKTFKQVPIGAKVTYEDSSYIAAYYLSRTTDFLTAEVITLPKNEIVTDLLVDEDQLYVLCAEPKGETCDVRVYAYVYNSFFYPLLSFESQNLPISFEKNGTDFYIGLGIQGYDSHISGTITNVTIPALTLKLIKDCNE